MSGVEQLQTLAEKMNSTLRSKQGIRSIVSWFSSDSIKLLHSNLHTGTAHYRLCSRGGVSGQLTRWSLLYTTVYSESKENKKL